MHTQSDCLTKTYASSTKHTYTVPSRVCQLFHTNDNEMHEELETCTRTVAGTAVSCKNAYIGYYQL